MHIIFNYLVFWEYNKCGFKKKNWPFFYENIKIFKASLYFKMISQIVIVTHRNHLYNSVWLSKYLM